jgi:cell wall assembly regulator SMI1
MTPKESIESVLYETFRDANGHTGQVELEDPLTAAELERFQEDQSAPLPPDILELLRFTSGFTLLGECVDFRGTNRSEFEPPFSWGLPLCSDGYGTFWIVDIDPSTGVWGPILFTGHDPPVMVIQSSDLVNFLEEFFNTFRRGIVSTLDQVYRVSFDIWRHDRGLRRVVEVRTSPDATIRTFVKDFKDDDYVADLRERIVGSGFSWARCGSAAAVKRHPCDLLFALTIPRWKGFLYWLCWWR